MFDFKDPIYRSNLLKALSNCRNIPYDHIRLEAELILTSAEQKYLDDVLKRLKAKEPLTKILGQTEFFGFPFKVTPDVLDPRIDSEVLVETFQDLYKDHNAKLKILDLGTGSGCLLLTLLKLYPNATGVGIDISREALAVAKTNAKSLGLLERADLRQGSWFNPLKQAEVFDCIISNPPYIKNDYPLDESVSDFDPHLALFGGDDGHDAYRTIITDVHVYLKGYFIAEIGFDQGTSVKNLINKNSNLTYIKCVKDYAYNDRVIVSKIK